jgi:hypothetical protein
MSTSHRPIAAVLAVCALSDLAAVPLVAGDDGPGVAVGVVVGLLGVLTAVAAASHLRGRRPARTLATSTRVVDLALSLPGLAAGGAVAGASAVTVALSLGALALLLRSRRTSLVAG